MVGKAPEAFRTIGEVSADLDIPKHVLRFWETKFTQVKPMKRGGGRRYYRPEDVALLRGIRAFLHDEGYTISGLQRIIRERGVNYIKDYPGTYAYSTARREHSQSIPDLAGETAIHARKSAMQRTQIAHKNAARNSAPKAKASGGSQPQDLRSQGDPQKNKTPTKAGHRRALQDILKELEHCRKMLAEASKEN